MNHPEHRLAHVEPRSGPSEIKCKLSANVATSVLLYRSSLGWHHQSQEILKNRDGFGLIECCVKVCQCLSHSLHKDGDKYTPTETILDEHKRVYSATYQISQRGGKALQLRYDERQVTFCKWEGWLSGSLRVHLSVNTQPQGVVGERLGQTDFYLLNSGLMSGHGAFNAYLFHMGLADNPKCANCDRKERDDDAWHTLFECPAFQMFQEERDDNCNRDGWGAS